MKLSKQSLQFIKIYLLKEKPKVLWDSLINALEIFGGNYICKWVVYFFYSLRIFSDLEITQIHSTQLELCIFLLYIGILLVLQVISLVDLLSDLSCYTVVAFILPYSVLEFTDSIPSLAEREALILLSTPSGAASHNNTDCASDKILIDSNDLQIFFKVVIL